MAKEKSERKEKSRKEDKEKRSASEGVSKKPKKEKKKDKKLADASEALLNRLDSDRPDGDEDKDVELADVKDVGEDKDEVAAHTNGIDSATEPAPIGILVPFANPLADEKVSKKVFKAVKKAVSHCALKRGVKEVVKPLRIQGSKMSGANSNQPPFAIVILAADISPLDIISHLPVLCEDCNVPYIYVRSRAELGAASGTKRPTSVAMVMRDGKGRKKRKDDAAEVNDGEDDTKAQEEAYAEAFAELLKVVEKAGRSVKI